MPLTPRAPASDGGSAPGARPAIPGYLFGDRLGVGGTAEVYAARRRADGAEVAVKILRSDTAQLVGIDRFLREVAIMAQLRSPRLVPLLDSGNVDGLPYYVMPLATRGTLRQRVEREGALPLAEALGVASQLAEALETLHSAGLVHRDVKPENVLLTDDHSVQLADYGIARALEAAGLDPITSAGLILGTPTYMSPEQGVGEAVDARSDLYSLGCLLYELLTGTPPFHAATALGVMARHRADPPPPLRAVRPDLPGEVERLVLQLLAKTPADRPGSATEVRQRIGTLDLMAPPAPAPDTVARTTGRRPWRVVAALAGVGGAMAALTWPRESARELPVDPDVVVVFPFTTDGSVTRAGVDAAQQVVQAFERTEPMQWHDGGMLLGPADRGGTPPAVATLARVAAGTGARYFVTGVIRADADSLRVSATLHDTRVAGATTRRTAAGRPGAAPGAVALDAMVGLIPALARVSNVDIERVRGRNPAALLLWLKGEKLYDESRMNESLDRIDSALARDSSLAEAALRGAMAAAWEQSDRGEPLVRVALRHEGALSPRQRLLARALWHYVDGRADSAVVAIRRLIEADSGVAESWMLAGETYRHLLPTITLDSAAMPGQRASPVWRVRDMARNAFQAAANRDSMFSPALRHLADDALMRGDLREAAVLVRRLQAGGVPDHVTLPLGVASRCLRGGPQAIDWAEAARRYANTAFEVGSMLSGGVDAGVRRCAKAAFTAMLDADTAAGRDDISAVVGLVALEVADGRDARAVALIDSAARSREPGMAVYHLLLRMAGVDVGDRDVRYVATLDTGASNRGGTTRQWIVGAWHALRGDLPDVRRISAALAAQARRTGTPQDSLAAAAMAGWLALSRGDTAAALRAHGSLRPVLPSSMLGAYDWGNLAVERLALARLQLARGDPLQAHRTASLLDHHDMLTYPMFLPSSLRIRLDAARAMGDSALARAAESRLPARVPR